MKLDERLTFDKIIAGHPSDVFSGSTVWKKWASGISQTGMNLLIEAAFQKSPGVPLPPDL